jgi:hypothetical protein
MYFLVNTGEIVSGQMQKFAGNMLFLQWEIHHTMSDMSNFEYCR